MRDEIRRAYEETPETALQIARRLGMTKNQIMGIVYREGWRSYNPSQGGRPRVRTSQERLAELNATYDAIKEATQVVLDNGGRRIA